MGLPAEKYDEFFTYQDYLTWSDDERWEIIEGVAYNMAPAPMRSHQGILRELATAFSNYLNDKPCEIYFAPFDVRLPGEAENELSSSTVIQPDLVVVCDEEKLDDHGCVGAPDLVVEVISPSTGKKDKTVKFDLYEKHGVREYWIVYPLEELVDVYILGEDGKYGKTQTYTKEDSLKVGILSELEVDLSQVFPAT